MGQERPGKPSSVMVDAGQRGGSATPGSFPAPEDDQQASIFQPVVNSPVRPGHHLPLLLTRTIGRESQIAEVKRLLQPPSKTDVREAGQTRLLTLVGPGGCGKTRLSIEAARAVTREFLDGVCWIELAPLSHPDLVTQTVASALGVGEQPGRPLMESITDAICSKQLLLVLDNCEHLSAACSSLAAGLLHTCPLVSFLTTSRAALNIPGEIAWPVPPLSSPDPQHLPPVQADPIPYLSQFESIRLFVERAGAVLPGFTLTEQNFKAVAQICHRLDGIPLAIELAAARVKVLTVQQIAERLDGLFRLLTRGEADMPRHQTLRATVDWSYELLSEPARTLLQRLSVFAGRFGLTAAETVCAGDDSTGSGINEYDVLDLLSDLVDHSLVLVSEREPYEEARYQLLEMIRQYAQEKLEESGEAGQVRERHLAFYLRLAEQTEAKLESEEQGRWLSKLESEHNNMRAALAWSQSEERGAGLELRLAGALWRFWEMRGYYSEGRTQLEAALRRSGEAITTQLAKALSGAGTLAWNQTDYAQATAYHEQALAVQRELGDRRGIGFSLNYLGYLALEQGDYERATSWLEESLALSKELDDRRMAGYALHNLGDLARYKGKFESAAARYRESLSAFRELKDKWAISITLNWLGVATGRMGEDDQAVAYLHEGLELCRELGDQRRIAEGLVGLAGVALVRQQPDWALQLLGAAEALREAINSPLSPADRSDSDELIADGRAVLGEAAFEEAWASGQRLASEGWEKVIAFALAQPAPEAMTHPAQVFSPRQAAKQKYGGLTAREREVAALVAQGKPNQEIAEALFVSLKTVEAHVTHILSRLGFNSRAQIAAWAVAKGLAEAPADLDTLARHGW